MDQVERMHDHILPKRILIARMERNNKEADQGKVECCEQRFEKFRYKNWETVARQT